MDLGDFIKSVYEQPNSSGSDHCIRAFLSGYSIVANPEIADALRGAEIISLELCARYLVDAVRKEYFVRGGSFDDQWAIEMAESTIWISKRNNKHEIPFYYQPFSRKRDKIPPE